MPERWRKILLSSVSPLEHGARILTVQRPRTWQPPQSRPSRTAAVLVGVVETELPEILLTRRAMHLEHHPGQVSFPGGSAEGGGETGVLTALREAHEEIGLSPEAVNPIGFLDRFDTPSDFRVLPVVGLVRQSAPWAPDGCEVDEVFTLPLELALDLDAYQVMEIERQGQFLTVYSLDWKGHRIWGVTAAILRNLAHRVHAEGAVAAG